MSIYEKIRLLAKEKKISIAELERTLNFGNSTIRKWEHQSPSVDRLQKVADYFNVSISTLINENNIHYSKEQEWIEELSQFILLKTHGLAEETQAYLIEDFKDYLEFKSDKVRSEEK